MPCGACGKSRQGSEAVKSRRRGSPGDAAMNVIKGETKTVPAALETGYTNRYATYLQDIQEYRSTHR